MNVGKENKIMKSSTKPIPKNAAKKAGFKYTKPIVIASTVLVTVLAAIIFLPKIF